MTRRNLSAFRRRDSGASEVIGFILMFLISSFLLVVAMQSFADSQEVSDDTVTSVELKNVAARVASRVLEASIVAQDFPNATYEIKLRLPPPPDGRDYEIKLTPTDVLATATKGNAEATTTTYKLDAISGLVLSGTVYSWQEDIVIRYEPTIDPVTKVITSKSITLAAAEV